MPLSLPALTGANSVTQVVYDINQIKLLAVSTSELSANVVLKANSHNSILTGNVYINSTNTVINSSATFLSNGAIKIPRGTTAQRDLNTPGSFRYNGQLDRFEGYYAGGWNDISGGDPAVGGDLTGTASNAQIAAGVVTATEIDGTVVSNTHLVATYTSNTALYANFVSNNVLTSTYVSNTYLQTQGYSSTGKAIAMALVFG